MYVLTDVIFNYITCCYWYNNKLIIKLHKLQNIIFLVTAWVQQKLSDRTQMFKIPNNLIKLPNF